MTEQAFFVPWIGISLNPSSRNRGWHDQMKAKKEGMNITHIILRQLKIKPFSGPIELIARPHKRGKQRDIANYSSAIKAIEDAVVKAGIIKDDNPKFVQRWVIEKPVKGERDGIYIVLREMSA